MRLIEAASGGVRLSTVESVEPSLWYKDAVIYQLHVKAYADGDGDGIGDFAGLMQKLPYIKELGATAIWLLPFYPSPLRDDGYDIAEYKGVNPSYGTLRDVRAFIRAAHKLDIRIITELVVNHTSDQHPWFQRARRAPKDSYYRKFYVWSDSPEKYAGTRIIFTDTETSNWAWDAVAQQYSWHRFFSHQPDLNFDHPPVFDAIVDVMRFWFAMGVDGMRLDAVPYLYEREGTSSENLPETHALLKRLRAILDAEFPDRLLLAEANMWPEDVSAYFGDGDECQMAFHFPLMPRMFMSIAEEDRYPLYDIMRQTPQIPANCQWAIFLRNHDELTLEMVTDRERAFMYSIYARETRARINVGIRRRLAPLMENDRRKIELMTSLLLSMPGTPIVYYGDEIGMGDNIYLGDRDGVRTPMQWSADRNGGFSRADTQRLFLPPIMDPVYGYASTNAEAQERSSSSLLQWMRRIIGVRQAHRVFGRGTITFLHPNNRHIAAYVREYEGDVVLCVANLSRLSQPVSLDLSRYAGRTPVEMIGWSPFPPIVDDRYSITLHGYGFFWFMLATEAEAPVTIEPATPKAPEFITVVLPRGRASMLSEPARSTLERDVLPSALAVRELLSSEQRDTAVTLNDIVPLAAGDDAPTLAILGVSTNDEALILPAELVHATDREWSLPELRAAFAKTRTGPREGLLLDAAIDDRLWCGLLDALLRKSSFAGSYGTLTCVPTWSLDALAINDTNAVRRPQSGDRRLSAVIGETVLLSLYHRRWCGDRRWHRAAVYSRAGRCMGADAHDADALDRYAGRRSRARRARPRIDRLAFGRIARGARTIRRSGVRTATLRRCGRCPLAVGITCSGRAGVRTNRPRRQRRGANRARAAAADRAHDRARAACRNACDARAWRFSSRTRARYRCRCADHRSRCRRGCTASGAAAAASLAACGRCHDDPVAR
jgi:maltose alpha-D-glucosyltransferase/alpha-amylase